MKMAILDYRKSVSELRKLLGIYIYGLEYSGSGFYMIEGQKFVGIFVNNPRAVREVLVWNKASQNVIARIINNRHTGENIMFYRNSSVYGGLMREYHDKNLITAVKTTRLGNYANLARQHLANTGMAMKLKDYRYPSSEDLVRFRNQVLEYRQANRHPVGQRQEGRASMSVPDITTADVRFYSSTTARPNNALWFSPIESGDDANF